ncbi:hypothetical protein JHK87_050165 [Glycine soja]|nr:hypothetical protein JHK87_050165 [Glycine soja]
MRRHHAKEIMTLQWDNAQLGEEQPSTWKNLSNTRAKFEPRLYQPRKRSISPTLTRLGRGDEGINCPENLITPITPHSASKSHILDQALATEILAMPKRANTPPKANFSKLYRYHPNRGHSTKECSILKDKIEDLIKVGTPKGFYPQASFISAQQQL